MSLYSYKLERVSLNTLTQEFVNVGICCCRRLQYFVVLSHSLFYDSEQQVGEVLPPYGQTN